MIMIYDSDFIFPQCIFFFHLHHCIALFFALCLWDNLLTSTLYYIVTIYFHYICFVIVQITFNPLTDKCGVYNTWKHIPVLLCTVFTKFFNHFDWRSMYEVYWRKL